MAFPALARLAKFSYKKAIHYSLGFLVGAGSIASAGVTAAAISQRPADYAAASQDPLFTPALKTPLAEQSLILDVARAGERLVAVGERGHILYSDDQGSSWLQAEVPVSVTLTAVDFPLPEKGWAVGHQGVILHSSDGGRSWRLQFEGLAAGKLWIEFAQKELERAEAALVEGETESEEAWDLADLALADAEASIEFGPAQPLLDVWFRNENEGFAVGSYGSIFYTRNGGKDWEVHRHAVDNPNNFHYYSIDQAPSGVLYLVGERGSVHRSTDSGKSWRKLEAPYTEGSFYRALAFEHQGQEVVLLLGFGGHIYRSADAGESWEKIEVPTNKSINDGVVMADGSVVLVGLNGVLLRSTNGGQGFVPKFDSRGLAYASVLALSSIEVLVAGALGTEAVAVTSGEERRQ